MTNLVSSIDIIQSAKNEVERFFEENPQYDRLIEKLNTCLNDYSLALLVNSQGYEITLNEGPFNLRVYTKYDNKKAVQLGIYLVAFLRASGFLCRCIYESDSTVLKAIYVSVGETKVLNL